MTYHVLLDFNLQVCLQAMAEPGAQQPGHGQMRPRSTHDAQEQEASSIQLTPAFQREQKDMFFWNPSNTTVNSAWLNPLKAFMCHCKFICCVVTSEPGESICFFDLAVCTVPGDLHGAFRMVKAHLLVHSSQRLGSSAYTVLVNASLDLMHTYFLMAHAHTHCHAT